VQLTIKLSKLEYRALSAIASAREVNAHVLVEEQVRQALAPALAAYAAKTTADPEPEAVRPAEPVAPRASAAPLDWSTYGPLSPSGLPAGQGRGGRAIPELTAARVAWVAARLEDEWPVSAIAHDLGLSRQGVVNIIGRLKSARNEGKAS
jgi:hypothetical protein